MYSRTCFGSCEPRRPVARPLQGGPGPAIEGAPERNPRGLFIDRCGGVTGVESEIESESDGKGPGAIGPVQPADDVQSEELPGKCNAQAGTRPEGPEAKVSESFEQVGGFRRQSGPSGIREDGKVEQMETSNGDSRQDVAAEGVFEVEKNQSIGGEFLDVVSAQGADAAEPEKELRRRAFSGAQPGPDNQALSSEIDLLIAFGLQGESVEGEVPKAAFVVYSAVPGISEERAPDACVDHNPGVQHADIAGPGRRVDSKWPAVEEQAPGRSDRHGLASVRAEAAQEDKRSSWPEGNVRCESVFRPEVVTVVPFEEDTEQAVFDRTDDVPIVRIGSVENGDGESGSRAAVIHAGFPPGRGAGEAISTFREDCESRPIFVADGKAIPQVGTLHAIVSYLGATVEFLQPGEVFRLRMGIGDPGKDRKKDKKCCFQAKSLGADCHDPDVRLFRSVTISCPVSARYGST